MNPTLPPPSEDPHPRGPTALHAHWTCLISSHSRSSLDANMAPKYSHVKKRGSAPPTTTSSKKPTTKPDNKKPSPHTDRNISQAMTAVAQLEQGISRILLIRYEQDMARLFSTHLYCVALCHLPSLVMRCTALGGPGWVAANADGEEIKEFFRSVIAMDLREAGERVATKSVLWSYTALRQFVSLMRLPLSHPYMLIFRSARPRLCQTMCRYVRRKGSIRYDSYPTSRRLKHI